MLRARRLTAMAALLAVFGGTAVAQGANGDTDLYGDTDVYGSDTAPIYGSATTDLGTTTTTTPIYGPELHSPRVAASAAVINVFYMPVRVALTAVTAVLGGLTGFLTFGDQSAANSIWGLTSGPQIITPEIIEGRERWRMGEYD